jgi:prevent-host-death family protein
MRTVTFVEAQNRLGELLDYAQREPVTITRRGHPVAYVLSPADMRVLLDAKQKCEETDTIIQEFRTTSDKQLEFDWQELSRTDRVQNSSRHL